MSMSLKDFICGLLALGAGILLVMMVGYAGTLEQNLISFDEGAKKIVTCLVLFLVVFGILFFIGKHDDREE